MKLLLQLSLCVALLGVLTGCSKRDERTEDGRLILEYWEKWTGFEKEAMEKVVEKYNNSQDRVFVRFVSTSQIDRKLLLATAGGNPPDIAGFWSHSLINYAEKGALIPLDRLMERDGIKGDDYLESIYTTCRFRGYTWGLPSTPATIALHYNKTMLEEAGIDNPPRTIAELDAMADALTKRDSTGKLTQMAFVPTDPGWWGPMWPFLFGVPIVSEDGTELLCDSEEFLESFRWFQKWITKYNRSDVRQFEAAHRGEFASSSNSFMSGRVFSKLQGVWMANFIETFAPEDFEWSVVPFPLAREGMAPTTVIETDLLVIPRGARHVDESWEFIKFVQQQQIMEQLCLDQKKFSPLKEVSEDFYARHDNPYIQLFRELAESPNARAVPPIPVWYEYRDELAVAIDQIWAQGRDVDEAFKAVKTRVQPKLDEALELWSKIEEQRLEEWSKL